MKITRGHVQRIESAQRYAWVTRQLDGGGALDHQSVEREQAQQILLRHSQKLLAGADAFPRSQMPCSLFGEQGRTDLGQRQLRRFKMLAEQCFIEPVAIRFAHEQFDEDGCIKIHAHHPRESRSSRTRSSAGGPPCTGCESRNSPIPVNRLRPWPSMTGESTALGTPSVVMVP